MRATLKIFGKTLSQVVNQVETNSGESAVLRSARVIAAGLAMTAVVGMAQAQSNDYGDARPTRTPAEQQADAAASAATAQEWKNTIAKVGGGLIGGLVGNNLTRGAGTLWKTVATLGGAVAGAAVGNALVPGPDGASRAPIAATGDMKYDAALASTYSPQTANGRNILPSSVHQNLASMMTNMAATRLVATKSLRDLDEKELAAASAPRDAAAASAFQAANRVYQVQFNDYAIAHRETWNVITLAASKGYDVTAQKTVMSTVPNDLRKEPSYPIYWPGVAAAAAAKAQRAGLVLNYAEIGANDEQPHVAPRQRQN